jgi:hypothetical protein
MEMGEGRREGKKYAEVLPDLSVTKGGLRG